MEESMLKKIGDGIANIAPTLGAVLSTTGVGAPAGAAVSAIGTLCKVFGLGSQATASDVATAMLADPAAQLKVAQAENDFKLEAMKNDTEALKLQLADVQSARDMKANETKATGKRDINIYILAWFLILGFFALMGILLFVKLPEDSSGVIYMLFGTLSTAFGAVINYFYGSSASSGEKTELLAKAQAIK